MNERLFTIIGPDGQTHKVLASSRPAALKKFRRLPKSNPTRVIVDLPTGPVVVKGDGEQLVRRIRRIIAPRP
jgi:hypothetical protein